MVVKGPPKDKKAAVEGIFESAKQHGAAQGTAEDLARARGDQPPGVAAFTGSVRTLDGRNDTVGAPPAQRSGPSAHTISFYSNGVFTVDEGPARGIADPENQEFMQSISKGECPAELEPEDRNTPVEVNLVRVEHEYQPPAEPRFNSFQGTGRKLTADEGGASSSAAAAAQAAPAGEWGGIDESQPSTSLQIRLADGSRMVAKFNLTHTVGDIRRFIRAARPDITGPYQLMTAFPSQPLADDAATIEGAGLKNAVVIQKQ